MTMGSIGKGPSTRRRNALTLLVLAVALLFVAAGYAVVPSLVSESEEEAEAASLLGLGSDEIEAILWEGDAGSGSIRRAESDSDGETAWISEEEQDAELDEDLCGELVSALVDAKASRTIPSDSVTEEMGLGDPDVTVEVELVDGSSLTLELSDPTGDGTACYARLGGDEASEAYLLNEPLAQTFAIDISSLYTMESGPSAYDITGLAIESSEGTFSLTFHEGGDEELSYTTRYEWFAARDGETPVAVDEDRASSLTAIVNYISWESCVDPTYDGSTDYGFGDPTLTATLSYTTSTTEDAGDTDGNDDYETVTTPGTFTLVVGNAADDGSYYAQPEGSSKVYTISADDVNELMGADVAEMLPDDICLIDWDTVDSVEVTVDGTVKTIELQRDGSSEEESDEDGNEARADSYLVNGAEADEGDVDALFDAIDALASEGEADNGSSTEQDPEITLVFHRSTQAFDTVTLSFTRYDTSFYLASLNGTARLLVNKNDVAKLEELVETL